jgi:hypothetical protein
MLTAQLSEARLDVDSPNQMPSRSPERSEDAQDHVRLRLLAGRTISQWLSHRSSLKDLYWCFLAAVSVIAINVTRISLMGLSEMHYQTIHTHWGDAIANLLLVGLTVGLCLLGVAGS